MSGPGRLPSPRPDLADLRPYGSSDPTTARVVLHANENPYPPPQAVMDEIWERARPLELNRYPPSEAGELVAELAAYADVDPAWVWVGDGSNEVLLQACLTYGGAGRSALLFEPTYRMHYRQARVAGCKVEVSPRLPDHSIAVSEAVAAIERIRPEIVFVCSPNNPTGTVTPVEDIRRIATASGGLVVADEAYFEFCGQTLVPHLPEHPNVIVVRTLSKAFGLAGLRTGYAIADPALLEPFRRVRMPYSLGAFALIAAHTVVRRRAEVLPRAEELVGERERVARRLEKVEGVEVFPSGANFLLFRHERAHGLLQHLSSGGIVIRDFTALAGCENCLRVTVGTPEENGEFLEAVTAFHG